MRVTMIVNDNNYQLDIKEDMIKNLIKLQINAQERVEKGSNFFYIAPFNKTKINIYTEDEKEFCNELYENANYYNDRETAEADCRIDSLMRKLRKYNRENKHDYDCKYYIIYTINNDEMDIISNKSKIDMSNNLIFPICFNNIDIAEDTKEYYYNDLIFYFTTYQKYL